MDILLSWQYLVQNAAEDLLIDTKNQCTLVFSGTSKITSYIDIGIEASALLIDRLRQCHNWKSYL